MLACMGWSEWSDGMLASVLRGCYQPARKGQVHFSIIQTNRKQYSCVTRNDFIWWKSVHFSSNSHKIAQFCGIPCQFDKLCEIAESWKSQMHHWVRVVQFPAYITCDVSAGAFWCNPWGSLLNSFSCRIRTILLKNCPDNLWIMQITLTRFIHTVLDETVALMLYHKGSRVLWKFFHACSNVVIQG